MVARLSSSLALAGLLGAPSAAAACPWCRAEVQQAVYAGGFLETAALLSLPLVVVALVSAAVYRRL